MGRENIILCPNCRYEYNHPVAVEVYPFDKTKKVNINNNGVSIEDTHAASSARGVTIKIVFNGECGHTWGHYYEFHKGETELHTINSISENELATLETIWRD